MKNHLILSETLRPVTNIRIVLVGARGSGKTSTLNTLLNRQSSQPARRTARCLAGTAVVFGRQLTVVDTPGWWMNYFCDESPVFDRRELLLSLSLCPPGPHVFLLVIRVDRAFTETYRRAAQEHLQLLGEHIWSRVIVLFSCGDWLGDTTVELCIESEGEPLRWLVERCNNRYHVLNNKTKGNGFQVRELIRKMEEMLSGCGQHCVVEREVMEHLERKRRREEERAKERLMRKEKQRQMARSQLEKLSPLPALRLLLVGGRKTGKSSCGDTILSREDVHTETQTTSCSEKQANISGKTVTVLDTPGCFSVTSDTLTETCAVLLVVNVSSSFTDRHMEAVEKQLEVGGGQMWSRAVVLFSHGDWLGDTSIEERIESEGEPLQRLVDQCGNRYHVLDNKERGDGGQVRELLQLVEEMLLAAPHRHHHMWKRVSSQDWELCRSSLNVTSGRHQMTSTESSRLIPQTSLNGQIVAVPAERTGLNILSCLASILSGKETLRWSINVPVWFPADDLHLRLNGEHHLFSSTHPMMLVVLPQTQRRMCVEESGVSVQTLCHPALRERTLRRLTESGGLQALIDQWGDSSLEELEAFIDSYFEMIWRQTMELCEEPVSPNAGQDTTMEEATQQNVLSSIDRKLSKLELLEEIQRDLAELRTSLHNSWEVIQDLRGKSGYTG